jgi:hypothetical protein
MFRVFTGYLLQQEGLGAHIDLGDEVDLPFMVDDIGLVKALAKYPSGLAGQLFQIR